MHYLLIRLKRQIEQLIMLPWVYAGKRYARRNPLDRQYDIFFFFPIYSIGGAEKVNIEVVKAFPDKKVALFFTKKSRDEALLSYFRQSNATISDISQETDNKRKYWRSFFWRGVCAAYINSQPHQPVVFVGQCNFGYKLLPHLAPRIRVVELIHNKVWQFAQVVLPYVTFIDCRIMIARFIQETYLGYYRKLHFPKELDNRIRIIRNAIEVPPDFCGKPERPRLHVFFAARGGPEKRLPLLFRVIRLAKERQLPFQFHLAGDYAGQLPEDLKEHIIWHGLVTDTETMYELQRAADVFILLSAFEGMPLTVMEAMANSTIPLATAVGGIPELISDGVTGVLINATEEDQIVDTAVQELSRLFADRSYRMQLSENAYDYARKHFSLQQFAAAYREALNFPPASGSDL